MRLNAQTTLIQLALRAFRHQSLDDIQSHRVALLEPEYARLLVSETRIEGLSLNDAMNLALNDENAFNIFVGHYPFVPEPLELDELIMDSADLAELEANLLAEEIEEPAEEIEESVEEIEEHSEDDLLNFMFLLDYLTTRLFPDTQVFDFRLFREYCRYNYFHEEYSTLQLLDLLSSAIDEGVLKVVRTEPALTFGFAISDDSVRHLQEMFEAVTS